MKLCAVVITSDTKENVVGDALRSVLPWVDGVLVLHATGKGASEGPPDRTMMVIRGLVPEAKLMVEQRQVKRGKWDMAEMRNVGLRTAARRGADWALMLDTDVRMRTNGADVRAMLQGLPCEIEAVAVMEDTGNYDKELFFRLPVQGAFRMGCHEEYTTPRKTTLMPTVRFHELTKSAEDLEVYHSRQLTAIQTQIEADPDNPRWRFYLGLALELKSDFRAAIPAYITSLDYTKEPGSLAWNCYRIARCHLALGEHGEGVRACLDSIWHDPSFAEPYWMAGLCCYLQGQVYQAIAWEHSAIAHSWRGRGNAASTRFGFKYTPALYEGPYEVLAEAYSRIGDKAKEAWAAEEIRKARDEREKFFAFGS